jgi:hypothetical protein
MVQTCIGCERDIVLKAYSYKRGSKAENFSFVYIA